MLRVPTGKSTQKPMASKRNIGQLKKTMSLPMFGQLLPQTSLGIYLPLVPLWGVKGCQGEIRSLQGTTVLLRHRRDFKSQTMFITLSMVQDSICSVIVEAWRGPLWSSRSLSMS